MDDKFEILLHIADTSRITFIRDIALHALRCL